MQGRCGGATSIMSGMNDKSVGGRARIEYLKVQSFCALRYVEFKGLAHLTVLLGSNGNWQDGH